MPTELEAAIALAVEKWGRLDVWVNKCAASHLFYLRIVDSTKIYLAHVRH